MILSVKTDKSGNRKCWVWRDIVNIWVSSNLDLRDRVEMIRGPWSTWKVGTPTPNLEDEMKKKQD